MSLGVWVFCPELLSRHNPFMNLIYFIHFCFIYYHNCIHFLSGIPHLLKGSHLVCTDWDYWSLDSFSGNLELMTELKSKQVQVSSLVLFLTYHHNGNNNSEIVISKSRFNSFQNIIFSVGNITCSQSCWLIQYLSQWIWLVCSRAPRQQLWKVWKWTLWHIEPSHHRPNCLMIRLPLPQPPPTKKFELYWHFAKSGRSQFELTDVLCIIFEVICKRLFL